MLNGTQVVRETIYNSSLNRYIAKDIRYFYDAEGRPTAIRYFKLDASGAVTGDTIYYLGTNLQGDVIAIYDSTGTKIYTYEYDAWGNLIRGRQLATGGSAANSVNPFRYRGYYYDIETGLYYLQSRYYNPQWGRFLNADGVEFLGVNGDLIGYNIFVYCSNNPINGFDPTGNWTIAFSLGASFSLFGKGITVSVGIAISSDDFTFQATYASSNDDKTSIEQLGENIGVSIGLQYTEFDSVTKLDGPMDNIGINTSVGSLDFLFDSKENKYAGWQIGVGGGQTYDIHRTTSYTYNSTVWKTWNPTKRIAELTGVRK